MRKVFLVLAALAVMSLPFTAAGAQELEFEAELELLGDAIDAFGVAVEGGDIGAIGDAYDDVTAAFEALAAADAGGALDTSGFVSAWEALGTAIEGGDIDEISAAAAAVEAAYADLVDQAAALQPTTTTTAGETTTSAAPTGGVDTGAGGTAGSDTFPVGVLGAAGAMSLLLVGLYALRRRTDS